MQRWLLDGSEVSAIKLNAYIDQDIIPLRHGLPVQPHQGGPSSRRRRSGPCSSRSPSRTRLRSRRGSPLFEGTAAATCSPAAGRRRTSCRWGSIRGLSFGGTWPVWAIADFPPRSCTASAIYEMLVGWAFSRWSVGVVVAPDIVFPAGAVVPVIKRGPQAIRLSFIPSV